MKFVSHMSKSYNWLCVKKIGLVGPATMTLQLPSLLDTSLAKCENCLLRRNLKLKLDEKPPNLIKRIKKKN